MIHNLRLRSNWVFRKNCAFPSKFSKFSDLSLASTALLLVCTKKWLANRSDCTLRSLSRISCSPSFRGQVVENQKKQQFFLKPCTSARTNAQTDSSQQRWLAPKYPGHHGFSIQSSTEKKPRLFTANSGANNTSLNIQQQQTRKLRNRIVKENTIVSLVHKKRKEK